MIDIRKNSIFSREMQQYTNDSRCEPNTGRHILWCFPFPTPTIGVNDFLKKGFWKLKDVLTGLTLNHSVGSLVFYESPLPKIHTWTSLFFFFFYSSNNKGGLLVHFWIVFVMPHAKGHIFCEDCVAAILKDSIQTSIINRTSVGSLQGLAVDMDSVVLNGDCWVILLHAFLPAALLILPLNLVNIVMKYSLLQSQ